MYIYDDDDNKPKNLGSGIMLMTSKAYAGVQKGES